MDFSNMTLLTDLYQTTMMLGYFECGMHKREAVFDLFYRKNPHGNGFAVFCGLEQVIDYIKNLTFSESDIDYMIGLGIYSNSFIEYLRGFKFSGEVYAVPEGTVVFPYEPLIRVKAPIIEAQLLETAMLNIINHQSLIATKAARVVWAAGNDTVLEFGVRRAQGPDAGIYGARAAIIGGCHATSNMLTGKMFGVDVRGTHAHSWVMSFDDELTAFREYARLYPNACVLLVDTYDTINSGLPNAIQVFNEMREKGIELKNYGIRLDSGDFAYLPKQARRMLDSAGFNDAVISASSDLDEYLIADLKLQGTKITLWGVGTSLITSKGDAAFGGVYKISAQESDDGVLHPRIKLSENPEKVTDPGVKKIFRLYDTGTGKIKGDLIALEHEEIDVAQPITIFDQHAVWKRMTLLPGEYSVRELMQPIFINGECVYNSPTVREIRDYCRREQETLWDEERRLTNPHILPVDLSQTLYDLKNSMISKLRVDGFNK